MNNIATPSWTGRKVLQVASNATKFVSAITKKLSDDFMVEGTKVGATASVRLPGRFITTKGQALQQQALVDVVVPITITDQANIAFGYSSFSGALEIQDVQERYVEPAAIQMANTWDADGLSRVYQDVFSVEGTPGAVPNANSTYLNAAARLTNFACPSGPRKALINALMRASIANANQNLFSVPDKNKPDMWVEAMFSGPALSWDQWYEDVNVFPHTIGALGGSPVVSGANQTGSSLAISGATATITNWALKGDVFTVGTGANATNAVNPQNYRNTTQLQQFVVTANANSDGGGLVTLSIYPPMVLTGAYQTVTQLPVNGQALTFFGAANTVTPQGLGFHPSAFVMATADLPEPNQGKFKRVRMPGIGQALRYWQASDIMTDQHPCRLDSIYGFKTQRPEFAVRFAS